MCIGLLYSINSGGWGQQRNSSSITIYDVERLESYKLEKQKYPTVEDYHKLLIEADREKRQKGYEELIKRAEERAKLRKEKERQKKLEEQRLAEEQKKLDEQRKQEAEEKQRQLEEEKKWKTFEVTAYTNGYESTSKNPDHPEYGITASGKPTQKHSTIACPPSMDFGTQIYIPKMNNIYTCSDRGADIVEGRLDIYMSSLEDARAFGRRTLEIEILN